MITYLMAAALMGAAPNTTEPDTLMALPVSPGKAGNGPFTIEVWPYEGCKSCSPDAQDLVALDGLLSDLSSSGQSKFIAPYARFTKVYGQADQASSWSKLQKDLATCRAGSKGMLAPNPTTAVVAFGVRFDCANGKLVWASVVLNGDHLVHAVYWMPDRPIFVARTR